ncbi:Transcription factor GRAS [Cynara cardunculus var. scolymus]|uniref:Transcription factor GRAS n=2 Tax=Cynara cardunculus var. scolymus TaxID=59895 RepID=A0A103XXY5_CYNCS|nr:Transcription factor GRAS [Cynara cardunculus var. scolymus]
MAPVGFLGNRLYNEQIFDRLKMGVHGVDPRFRLGGTKRKVEAFSDLGTTELPVNDEDYDGDGGRNLSISSFHHRRYLPVLDNPVTGWQLPGSSNGKMKRSKSMPESSFSDNSFAGIHRSSSTNSFPKLRFRDHIWTYTKPYLEAEAIKDAISEYGNVGDDGNKDEMHLVQLLVSCAEAVACRDKTHASNLLAELRADALVFGSSFQRVASCFMQGLTDRLAMVQPLGAVGLVAPARNVNPVAFERKDEAFRLVYETCPHIRFGHYVANLTILEAFEGESYVHVVDLGMTLGLRHGQQWRALIQSLAGRANQTRTPHRLRITAVGPCVGQFVTIGNELETYAGEHNINLEFSAIESSLETLKREDIKTYKNEVLVINSILQLHCVVKESRGALNSVLQIVHGLSPKAVVLVEQDSNHNGPFFLGRFMESLHYYSAIFDALDAMLPKYDTKRAKIEQFYFAEEIKNIVSCEGPNRVERHERVDQWRRRMSRAGFQAAPIKLAVQAKHWLEKLEICDGYTIAEEKGCLVLGWKSRPIVAVSCWKC